MSEYVYCLSNPNYITDLYKIGFTHNNPNKRAEELYSTGVPGDFVIEFIIKTNNGKLLEKNIHDALYNYRTNKKREFFKIPMTTLKNILETELNLNLNYEYELPEKSDYVPKLPETPELPKATHYECECSSNVLMSHKARHLNSPLHLNFINKVEPKAKAERVVQCGCGKKYTSNNKSHHEKTKHHVKWNELKKESI